MEGGGGWTIARSTVPAFVINVMVTEESLFAVLSYGSRTDPVARYLGVGILCC